MKVRGNNLYCIHIGSVNLCSFHDEGVAASDWCLCCQHLHPVCGHECVIHICLGSDVVKLELLLWSSSHQYSLKWLRVEPVYISMRYTDCSDDLANLLSWSPGEQLNYNYIKRYGSTTWFLRVPPNTLPLGNWALQWILGRGVVDWISNLEGERNPAEAIGHQKPYLT